jgi:hypothetical protein
MRWYGAFYSFGLVGVALTERLQGPGAAEWLRRLVP